MMSNRPGVDGQRSVGVRPLSAEIFISYTREDEISARSLRDALFGRGFTVWSFDKQHPGDSVSSTIEEAIATTGVVIVLISRNSLSSRWLRSEVQAALETRGSERVIPVATEELDLRTLPDWLGERNWLHLTDVSQTDEVVARLVPSLETFLGPRNIGISDIEHIHGDVPVRVPLVGSDEYIEQIKAAASKVVVVTGSVGSGKSSILRELVYRLRGEVAYTYWINAVDFDDSAASSLYSFIDQQRHELGPAARGWVVVDGLDENPEISMSLADIVKHQEDSHQRLAIATRTLSSLGILRYLSPAIITLGRLQVSEIRRYLDIAIPNYHGEQVQDVESIVQSAGGSPLALELCTQLLKHSSGAGLQPALTFDSLIEVTIEQLMSELSRYQRERLWQLSYCSELLPVIASNETWALEGDRQLFEHLAAWNLLKPRRVGFTFAHRLLSDYLRRRSPGNALEVAAIYVRSHLPDPSDPRASQLLEGVASFTQLADLKWSARTSESLAELAIWQAVVWRLKGELARAEQCCVQASRIAVELDDVSLRIRILNLGAALASDQGRLAEANQVARRAADLAFAELGSEHPVTIASLANIATTLRMMGEIAEAVTLLKQVVEKYRVILPAGHPDLLDATTNLALCLREAGLVDEALHILEKARKQSGSSWLRNQLDQAFAAVLTDVGRLDEAAAVLREVLERLSDASVVESSEQLAVRANLATILERQGLHTEVIELRRRVLIGLETLLGPENPSTLSARVNHALSLFSKGNEREALSTLEYAVVEQSRVLGQDHPESLQSRAQLVAAKRDVGHGRIALNLYDSLLADAVRVLGPESIFCLRLREDYAGQLMRAGESAAAQLAFRELLADLRRVLPPEHSMLRRVEKSLGA